MGKTVAAFAKKPTLATPELTLENQRVAPDMPQPYPESVHRYP